MSSLRPLKLHCSNVMFLFIFFFPSVVLAQNNGIAPGVNPRDNITKTEIIFNHNNFTDHVEINSLAFKFDYALGSVWGANVEIPVLNLEGQEIDSTGIGDIAFRVRNVSTSGPTSLIKAVEIKTPTANSDSLGTGKWQLNPVIGGVYSFNDLTFGFLGYKHFISVAGKNNRADINMSEVRLLLARLSLKARWALGDLKYTKSWEEIRPETLDFEIEYGQMISESVALSGRLGTSFLDSDRNHGVTINLRKIW